jgi:hypothetical protein
VLRGTRCRIEIDDQTLPSGLAESGRDMDRDSGLPHSTFLVSNGDHLCVRCRFRHGSLPLAFPLSGMPVSGLIPESRVSLC